MKEISYRVYKLRDPVFADRYWNGVALVKKREHWKNRIGKVHVEPSDLAAIKFSANGKAWASRSAAMAAYREYQITAAMVLHYKLATNKNWDALPLELDLVTIEVTKKHVKEEALRPWPQATIFAGHRTSYAKQARVDFVERVIQMGKAPLTKYIVYLPLTTNKGVPAKYRDQLEQVGIDPLLINFPFVAIGGQTDLTAMRLLFDRMDAWEFETGVKVI